MKNSGSLVTGLFILKQYFGAKRRENFSDFDAFLKRSKWYFGAKRRENFGAFDPMFFSRNALNCSTPNDLTGTFHFDLVNEKWQTTLKMKSPVKSLGVEQFSAFREKSANDVFHEMR